MYNNHLQNTNAKIKSELLLNNKKNQTFVLILFSASLVSRYFIPANTDNPFSKVLYRTIIMIKPIKT